MNFLEITFAVTMPLLMLSEGQSDDGVTNKSNNTNEWRPCFSQFRELYSCDMELVTFLYSRNNIKIRMYQYILHIIKYYISKSKYSLCCKLFHKELWNSFSKTLTLNFSANNISQDVNTNNCSLYIFAWSLPL